MRQTKKASLNTLAGRLAGSVYHKRGYSRDYPL